MRQRYLLLFLLLVLGGGSLHAQESLPSASFKQQLRGQYLHNGTAQAIINLYSKRQAGGASWVISAVVSGVRLATLNSMRSAPSPGYAYTNNDNGNNAAVAAVVALPLVAYGIGKLIVFSNSRLDQTLVNYAAGKPLLHSLRRKLKPRFFAQPIILYTPVKVQPVK